VRSKEIVVCTDDNELIVDIPSLDSEDQRIICRNGYKVIVAGEELEAEKIEPQETRPLEVNEDELVGYIMRKVASDEKDWFNLTYKEVRAVLDAELGFYIEKGIVHEE